MVIYDTKNNNNGQAKGQLYLNVMDIDYIVTKYGIEKLSYLIHPDYIDCFKDELDKIKDEDKLSVQYYASLALGIETTYDEKLLDIIQIEIYEGNMFTKKELSLIKLEVLKQNISEIESLITDDDNLNAEYLYKLRSYKMAEYILKSINSIKKIEEQIYSSENIERKDYFKSEYLSRYDNLISIGLSDKIYDSEYFNSKVKRYNKNKKINR